MCILVLGYILSLCVMLMVCVTSMAQYHHHDDLGSVCFSMDDNHSHSTCSNLVANHFHSQSHSSTCSQHLLPFYELPRTDDEAKPDTYHDLYPVFVLCAPLSIPLPNDIQIFVIELFNRVTPEYCDNIRSPFPTRGSPLTVTL